MAGSDGYSVGNLKIAFNSLDQTSDDFKKLATNLRAVANLINRISTADLGKFTANVKEITKAFNPFLTRLEKSTAGLQAFDSVARQIGVRNISSVAQNFDDIQRATEEAADGVAEFNAEIVNGDSATREYAEAVSNVADSAEEIKNPFNVAQAQVAKLTQEMLNLHFATGNLDNGAIQEIRDLTSAILASQNAVKQALMSEEELVIEKYKDIQATRKQRIAYLEAKLAMGASGKQARQYAKELAELRKQDGQVGKKSGFQKFLGQVKRIAIYRLIRSGLKAVTSAFKDGIGALAQFDSGVNKTMSQLTTSFTVIKLSVSTALLPLLQSITPIIQKISVGFANMANVISASMSKTGYYTKINTDRLLAYNKAANLFDFDKFRSLNKGDDAMNLLSTEKVEDLNKDLGVSYANYVLIYDIIKNIGQILGNIFGIVSKIGQSALPIITTVLSIADAILYVVNGITWVLDKSGLLTPVLYAILGYFTAIGATKFITWLKSGALATWFKTATASASGFGTKLLAVLGTTQALAVAIGALIGGISYYIQNLDKMSTTAKVLVPVIAALAAVFTGLAVAKAAAAAGIAAPAMAGITAGALAAAIALAAGTAISVGVGKFANGGMPDKGSLFVAGESGAEFVYNMPSGQSGVANVQQIAQAMKAGCLAALQEYGASRGDLGDISFDLDGEQIYRNTTSHAKKHGYAWRKV